MRGASYNSDQIGTISTRSSDSLPPSWLRPEFLRAFFLGCCTRPVVEEADDPPRRRKGEGGIRTGRTEGGGWDIPVSARERLCFTDETSLVGTVLTVRSGRLG